MVKRQYIKNYSPKVAAVSGQNVPNDKVVKIRNKKNEVRENLVY